MKKTLIAMAALAATGAFAQVSIVGTFDPSIAFQSTTYGNGNAVSQSFVRNNSRGTSQITFKGEEDLGGGLKASFLLENDFDTAIDATGNFGSKGGEQFLGLSGGFGSLKIGAANTPSLTTQAGRQPIGTKIGSGFGGVLGTAHVRNNNSFVYQSPSFSGFSVALGYAFKTNADANPTAAVAEAGDKTDLGLFYMAGPLAVGASFYSVPAVGAVNKNLQTNLFANYTIGALTLMAGYHDEEINGTVASVANQSIKSNGSNIGFKYAVSPAFSLLGNYGSLDDKSANNNDKTIMALGGEYALSKRTTVYARYVDEKTENTAATAAAATAAGTAFVKGVTTTLVGIQHNF